MLFSCGEKEPEAAGSVETLMTEYSDSLSIIMSRNGRRSYHFTAPQLEGYTLAREPYREFRKGVKITTYQDDSLSSVDAVLTANYAIYYENQELWEAKGNVVVRKSDGKTLYTQQLFWNARTDKVYSNVDSKIVQNNGRDVFIGEGFESDASFKEWVNADSTRLSNNGGDDTISAVTAMGYDAYYFALQAIQNAGSTDPADIMEALWTTEINGVTGHIALEQVNGDAIRNTVYVKHANTETGGWDALPAVVVD